ncbi:TetR/AcrR family transcriptional regulator [Bradyrhizobium sp. STM 3843]|uniref:TetR/AcrR family transcriptional regulator n=1 Tax=Bradyrhizobium sp. STM 3843 TaxID=551947 RepID=UPI000314B8EC|nr:TetR/AcrR family transcriptional regulator [Bradyrhizobium sp. STM 3843]
MPMKSSRKSNDLSGKPSTVAILDAAQRLFLEAGYDGVNLEQVGQAAGVSRQTVYNQFGSKDAVFQEVVERHWQTVRQETASAFAEMENLQSPAAMLRSFASALLRFVTETDQVAFTRLVIAESRSRPWIAAEFYRAGKEPILRAFAGALAAMTSKGLLTCAQPELAAHQFMGLVQEFVIWPKVMAIGDALAELPPSEVVIDEAVTMFLKRYGA